MYHFHPRVVSSCEIHLRLGVFIRILVAGFFAATSAFADSTARSTTDLVYEMAEARFELAELVLRTSANYLAAQPDVSAADGHLALKSILNGSEYFRAILALNENGELLFDSFNSVGLQELPSGPRLDLSGRKYFRSTTNLPSSTLKISPTEVGKQSGESFIPLTMSVQNETGFNQPVVVLVAPPQAFLPPIEVCSYCGIVMALNGEVLGSNRPMSEINRDVIARMSFDGEYGANQIDLRGMKVNVHWRKSPKTGVVFLFYKADPSIEG